jgi:competence protein ComEA
LFQTWSNREIKLMAVALVCVILLLSTLMYFLFTDRAESTEEIPLGDDLPDGGFVEKKEEAADEPTEIVVDVKGAVKQPGIYRLPPDSRLYQAIEAAGGATDEANTDQLNLADFLIDGMAVIVPREGEELHDTTQGTGGEPHTGTGKVNINRASEAELQTLSGIGPTKAAAIVKDREENGPFKTVDDLTRVSGIGDKTLENIKDDITVR